MANIGTLTVRLVATATQFEKTLQQATKTMTKTVVSMQKQADSMQKIGAAMTLGITTPLLGAGTAVLKLAGDMEQTRMAFTNMLGSAQKSQEFLDQLADFAEKTPFEYTDLTQQARQLMAFGFAAEDVIPLLTAVGDAVAAMGGGADMLDRVTRALSQMRAKQKVSAEEMLQLAEAGIPAYEYLAQAIGKSVPETMKLAQKGLIPANAAINAILSAMERDFGGMMAQQAQTMLGSWSNLRDVLGRFGRTLGEAINRSLGLTQKIQQLTNIVQMAADAFEKMNPTLKSTVIWLGIGVMAIGPLLLGLSMLVKISTFASLGIGLITSMAAKAAFAFSAWRMGAATLGEALVYLAGSKFRLFIFGVGGIITVSLLLIAYWDKVVAFAKAAWFTIGAAVLYGASLVVRGVGLILSGIGAIIPAVKGAAQAVLGLADSLKASAGRSLAAAKSAVSTASAGNQIANVQKQIAKVGQNAADAQEQLGKATEDAAKAAESNIQSFDEVHQIQESMAKSPAADMQLADISMPEMPSMPGVGDIAAGVAAGISEQMGGIMDTLSSAWDRLAQAMAPVNNAIQWIKDNWPTIGPIMENIASIIAVILVPWFIELGIKALISGGRVVLSWAMQGAQAIISATQQVIQFAILVGKWVWLGIQATINAAKVVAAWVVQKIQAIISAAAQVAQFVLLVGKWIWLGVQATINAAKVVAAWIAQKIQAIASAAVQVGQFALLVGKWIWLGVQAMISGAKVVAAWIMQQGPAIATASVTVAQGALIVGRWILMGATAMAQAAKMAAAWLISIGPIALVVAAVVGLAILIISNWDTIKAKTIEIWNKVSGTLKDVWDGIKKKAETIWSGIENTVRGVVNGIIRAINWMIRALNKINFTIPDWVPAVGGKSFGFNLREIPLLGQGGIVTRPTLAMIGESGPEAVVPLSRAQSSDDIAQAVYQAMMDAFRIQNATQNGNSDREIVLKIDSTTFARLLIPAIIKESQRQGLNVIVQTGGV